MEYAPFTIPWHFPEEGVDPITEPLYPVSQDDELFLLALIDRYATLLRATNWDPSTLTSYSIDSDPVTEPSYPVIQNDGPSLLELINLYTTLLQTTNWDPSTLYSYSIDLDEVIDPTPFVPLYLHSTPPQTNDLWCLPEIARYPTVADSNFVHHGSIITPLPMVDRNPEPHSLLLKQELSELADGLAKLPLELISMIIHDLLHATESRYYDYMDDNLRKGYKSILSQTSLVCRKWCPIQRVKLFATIRLQTPYDVRFLLGVLHRPENEYLSAAVTRLHINSRAPTSMDRSCRMLLRKVPSLATLTIATYGKPNMFPFPSSLQQAFAHHHNIKRFSLKKVIFHSFSALVHVLGDMVNLEELALINCARAHSDNRPPTRMSSSNFPKLRHFWCTADFEGCRELGWLFAPLLARRRNCHSDDVTSGNSDAKLLTCFGIPCESMTWLYDEGTDTITISQYCNLDLFLDMKVALWPSASALPNGRSSAIRSIKCSTSPRKIASVYWESLDRPVTDATIRLQEFFISINEDFNRPTLSGHLGGLNTTGTLQTETCKDSNDEEI